MPQTQITPVQNFEQRISEKIRETFADLVRQDELDSIVKKVIQDALYKERTVEVQSGYPNYRSVEQKPSIVQECLDSFMRPEIKKCVEKWLVDNPEKIFKMIETTVTKGVASCVFNELDNRFGQSIHGLVSEVDRIRNGLNAKGINIQ